MKALATYLILLGIIWVAITSWMYLVSGLIAFLGLSVAPTLLILGPMLVLSGWHAKLGVILTLLGCGIITVYIAYGITGLFQVQPLQAPPPYVLYALLAVLTLFGDFAAIRFYQIVASAALVRPHH